MEAKKLEVHLDFGVERHFVGTLAFLPQERCYAFGYEPAFVARGLEISPFVLPLGKAQYRTPRQSSAQDPLYGIHSVFADSLPDVWGLRVQDEAFATLGILDPGPLERLAFIGEFGMGALRYRPAQSFADDGPRIVDVAQLRKEAQQISAGEVHEVSTTLMRAGGSAGGMRPKFLVHFSPTNQSISYGLPLLDESSGVPAIIKVPLRHSEEYQQIEYVYSQMARLCGITIPRTWLLCSHEHHYFLIERFDCTARGERVHLHSAAGLMGVNFEEIAGEYRELLSLTATLTRDQVQVDELYKRMLFNALGYNCDDHYKNVSFVMDHAGSWRLSPAYDVCYSRGRNGVHATRLNNKIDGFDKKDFARIAQEAGVKSWETMVAEVVEALSAWRELAAQAHISSQRSAQIQQLIEKAISSV